MGTVHQMDIKNVSTTPSKKQEVPKSELLPRTPSKDQVDLQRFLNNSLLGQWLIKTYGLDPDEDV